MKLTAAKNKVTPIERRESRAVGSKKKTAHSIMLINITRNIMFFK